MNSAIQNIVVQQFDLYDDKAMALWDEFVIAHSQGTPFHLSGWLRCLVETYGYQPMLLAGLDDRGYIFFVFPLLRVGGLFGKRLVSLPFSDYGGILCSPHAQSHIGQVFNGEVSGKRRIEIRGPAPDGGKFNATCCYARHILDFSLGLEDVKRKLDKRTIAYNIRKAERLGVEVREGTTMEDVNIFCRMNALTRKKHGVPAQPQKFFEKIFEHLISKGRGSVFMAFHDSQVIGAILVLYLGKTIHYKYNASDPSVLSKVSPNHLMTWRLIEQGYARGYQFLDFGRTACENEGLMRYKQLWGATKLELTYHSTGQSGAGKGEGSIVHRVFRATWKNLPETLTDKIGPRLMKYVG